MDEDEDEDAPEQQDGRSRATSGSVSGLRSAPKPLRDMPEATRALDQMLYNVLKMNVKGSKAALLR